MKAPTKLILFALPILFVSTLDAAEPTPWDTMQGRYGGDITITPNSGKQVRGHGSVFFAPDAATFDGVSYLRGDVREVVIRRPRGTCCDSLALGVVDFVFLVKAIVQHKLQKDSLPFLIMVAPVIVGAAAVTGPPWLIIEGFRRLIPAEVAYRVVP
jgi:hypothetical protein